MIYEIPVLKNPLPISKGTVNLNQQQADVFGRHPSDRNFFVLKVQKNFFAMTRFRKGFFWNLFCNNATVLGRVSAAIMNWNTIVFKVMKALGR